MDTQELAKLLTETAARIDSRCNSVQNAAHLQEAAERVSSTAAAVLWRELKGGILGKDWIPFQGFPIDDSDPRWLWVNFLWPFLRAKVSVLAIDAGTYNRPRTITDEQGRTLCRDGQPFGETDAEIATTWDSLDAAGRLHVARERYSDWADMLRAVARKLESTPRDAEGSTLVKPTGKPGPKGPPRAQIKEWQELERDWLKYKAHCEDDDKRARQNEEWQRWRCKNGESDSELTLVDAIQWRKKFEQHLRNHSEDAVSIGNSDILG